MTVSAAPDQAIAESFSPAFNSADSEPIRPKVEKNSLVADSAAFTLTISINTPRISYRSAAVAPYVFVRQDYTIVQARHT